MKKRILFSLVLAIVMVFSVSAIALADDPTVSISGSSDRIDTGVNGNFGSGTIAWNFDVSTGTHVATTTFTGIIGGNLGAGAAGKDTTVCHPGVVGELNGFTGIGAFTATYQTQTNGNYGILNSYVNASSGSSGALFQMNDTQFFNIMSGNHAYNVVGNFAASASGNDNQAAMNLKSVGSMYCWSEATNPYSSPGLRGNAISAEVWATKNGNPVTDLYMGVSTDGIATISNSNIWGFGNNEAGAALSTTNYGGGTRNVSATGTGTYTQTGFGANNLNFNGFNFGAGNASLIAGFVGGMSGIYTMDAR